MIRSSRPLIKESCGMIRCGVSGGFGMSRFSMAQKTILKPSALMMMNSVTKPLLNYRYYSNDPFPMKSKEKQEQKKIESLPKWKQWAIYFESQEFKKSMTVYYIGGFLVLLVAFYFYMRDRYYEDKQIEHIKKKYHKDPSSLSEYEYLKLKALSNEKLKPKEAKKFKLYQMMRKEFRRKHILDKDVMFEPSPEDLDNWYNKQTKRTIKKAPVDQDQDQQDQQVEQDEPQENSPTSNHDNPHIHKPEDTTQFFESKAAEYDDEIKWEERAMLLGKRRKWLMKQLTGDVLEVACGTGRNIPYFDPELVNSITFLDSSNKMVELTQKKFRKKYPKFKNAAFTVGKAEELVNLAGGDDSVKYDTIVEAFGLCSHEDPVKALQSMTQLLRPGGRIVLLEHGRSTWDFINNHLDFRSDKRMKTWACRWNLDIGELVDESGLDITYEKRVHFGSTWLLVCKRPEDPINTEEKPFLNKLFGTEFKPIKKN